MGEVIKERKDFSDFVGLAYVKYAVHEKVPCYRDYQRGKRCEIVLRNEETGCLERIRYEMTGAVPRANGDGYHWFWGKIDVDGPKCCLVFNFNLKNECYLITASFCGDGIDFGKIKEDESRPYGAAISI